MFLLMPTVIKIQKQNPIEQSSSFKISATLAFSVEIYLFVYVAVMKYYITYNTSYTAKIINQQKLSRKNFFTMMQYL